MKVVFTCCYCAGNLDSPESSIRVVMVLPDEREQTWWAHRECFEEKLHPSYRDFLDDVSDLLEGRKQ